ncbi:MAG TPA: glycosyltransferase [Thermoanaerobaculia bacterium]
MERDVDILCLANIDWDFNWQAAQEVASAFAAAGHRVLFVENTGVRPPALKDLSRLRARLHNWWRARAKTRVRNHGVDVYSPLLVPLPYSRLACRVNARAMLRAIRRWRGDGHARSLIVITFLPTPLARRVIAALSPALVVYYAVDCLSESSPAARPLRPYEESLFREADVVFCTSDALRSFAEAMGARPELLAHGVRFHDFQRARRHQGESPALLNELTGPVIGFVGSIRREIDLLLVAETARRAPDLHFVFVGPIMTDVAALTALPNVHFIAPVPHADVMRYMVRFDVGILPYVQNAYTAHIMPAKLKEYLAAGLPVVATHLPEICRFARRHEGVITFAHDAEELAAALRGALAERRPSDVERRAAAAAQYDWETQIDTMRRSIENALHARAARR